MRLSIKHTTRYDYSAPVPYGVQQIRLSPKATRGQIVRDWKITVEGGQQQVAFDDHHRNHVILFSFEPEVTQLVVRAEGVVEMLPPEELDWSTPRGPIPERRPEEREDLWLVRLAVGPDEQILRREGPAHPTTS